MECVVKSERASERESERERMRMSVCVCVCVCVMHCSRGSFGSSKLIYSSHELCHRTDDVTSKLIYSYQ